jgi:enterochelin esterase family protein
MRSLLTLLLLAPLAVLTAADAPKAAKQAPKKQDRPTPPTRAFDAPGAPAFVRLDTKTSLADGNYLVGPTYVAAPETKTTEGVPQGKIQQFQIDSKTTQRFNPGIARDVFGTPDPKNPKTLIVDIHNIDYKRTITVYIPAQYVPGTAAQSR